ncbi:uncharacterized protein LOC130444870 [Diorhabda sublineata]|uniref:uncharacterized protein LOC130444870 n=1 Tax=Diorhabda sublineata TaxID=1163346 RepID=UPI0024E19385|nr:uncharacterized protein LOC130444870 [Diorhabda sublineata]
MYSTPDLPQQWSVHAEFTINHPGVGNPQNPPKTGAIQDENGVRMLYSWTSSEPATTTSPPTQSVKSDTRSSKTFETDRLYGFQKGRLFFTSTPPPKPMCNLNIPGQDSAYGSDVFSPTSCISSNYHRKCRSTCNIVLSSNKGKHKGTPSEVSSGHSVCGRTQSLRCQTPSVCCEREGDGFYGCGDPWCHHLHYSDEFSSVRRVSPVKELCENVGNTAAQDQCGEAGCSLCCRESETNRSIKRDVSVQTYEMVNKCTSPLSQIVDMDMKTSKLKRGKTIGYNRSRQSSRDSSSTVSRKRNILEQNSSKEKPSLNHATPSRSYDKKGSGSDSKSGDSSKKPRTIHIDVYCTGTEIESDSSSSSTSSRSKTVSTPQTVFESKNMCITHKNADDKIIPYRLRKSNSDVRKSAYQLTKTNSTSMEKEDSDIEDTSSTAYPSKMSSYSTIGHSLSSVSSFPNSITPFTMSSCTVPDYESSIGNTSWKDTFSDLDSLLHSRSSIPQNDSLYFVPQRIEEESCSKEESSKISGVTDSVNLHLSDSFDYADSEDKLRIKRMERMWKHRTQQGINSESKNKLLQQQENLQEIVNKRLSRMNISKSKDSDSDASDKSEKGWTILKETASSNPKENTSQSPLHKSPSAVIIQERLSLDPSLGSPFTIYPGQYTEPRFIAKKFGSVVTVFKKPGHHIGPAKNPNCSCEHCRRYFENSNFRNRTCSLGDTPSTPFFNWKGLKKSD